MKHLLMLTVLLLTSSLLAIVGCSNPSPAGPGPSPTLTPTVTAIPTKTIRCDINITASSSSDPVTIDYLDASVVGGGVSQQIILPVGISSKSFTFTAVVGGEFQIKVRYKAVSVPSTITIAIYQNTILIDNPSATDGSSAGPVTFTYGPFAIASSP